MLDCFTVKSLIISMMGCPFPSPPLHHPPKIHGMRQNTPTPFPSPAQSTIILSLALFSTEPPSLSLDRTPYSIKSPHLQPPTFIISTDCPTWTISPLITTFTIRSWRSRDQKCSFVSSQLWIELVLTAKIFWYTYSCVKWCFFSVNFDSWKKNSLSSAIILYNSKLCV